MLSEALERHKGQIAVAQRPIALNHKCNPVMPKRHKGKSQFACEYAKLALAVWLEDPTKFVEFHNWLMEDEKIPTVTAAKRHAMRLVGWRVLSDGLYSDAVNEMLNSNHEIFAEKIKRVPVLIVGNFMVAGVHKESADFDRVFQEKLDLSDDGAQPGADDSARKVETTTNVLLDADSDPFAQLANTLAGADPLPRRVETDKEEEEKTDDKKEDDEEQQEDNIALDDFFNSLDE